MDICGWKFIILTVTISRTSTSDLTTHDIDTVTWNEHPQTEKTNNKNQQLTIQPVMIVRLQMQYQIVVNQGHKQDHSSTCKGPNTLKENRLR